MVADRAPEAGANPDRLHALKLVRTWLDRTQVTYEVQPAGIVAALPKDEARGRATIQLRIGLPPAIGGGILFSAVGGEPVPRDRWPAAMALCTDWNARVLAPRARLCVTGWDKTSDVPIALESYLPHTADLPLSVVATTGTGLIRAALQFWTPARQASATGAAPA